MRLQEFIYLGKLFFLTQLVFFPMKIRMIFFLHPAKSGLGDVCENTPSKEGKGKFGRIDSTSSKRMVSYNFGLTKQRSQSASDMLCSDEILLTA